MSIECGGRLAFLEISGEPFDTGVELGRFGARAVHGHLRTTRAWATVIGYRKDPRILGMARQVEERFPRYFAEITGLAHGLDLPFDEVFAWNCRGDIQAIAPDGCTTVQVPGPRRVIAHNEDGDPGFQGSCALARIVPKGGTAFSSFIYPGSLPGHAFAATDAGLVQTVNNIRELDPGEGLPRMILTRAVLDCTNLDEAVALLRTSERASAFHLTLGKIGDPRLLSVEFATTACSVHEITAPHIHANHLIHDMMLSIPQRITASSASRQDRGDRLVSQGLAERDPLAILQDDSGPDLPIRRDDPQDPDHENTLATAIFFIGDERIEWLVYDKRDEPARFHIRERLVSAA